MDDKAIALEALLKLTGGDSAEDFIALEMPNGSVREFQFHPCIYSRNPYLMIAEPPLRDGIYVLAIRDDPEADRATLVGWEWAAKVRAQPLTSAGLDGSHGHAIARRYLRKMGELKPRVIGPVYGKASLRSA